MKRFFTKCLAVIFVVSLILSFAACGKEKDGTAGVPTTAQQTTAEPTTAPAATPISADLIRVALGSAGSSGWDGNYISLTAEQKRIISDYFTAAGKVVEFRADNVYFIDSTGETTAPVTEETTAAAGTTAAPVSGVSVTGLTLSPATINLYVGESKTITATVSPGNAKNKTTSWKSENEKVAIVNASGLVIAKSTGTAKIVCTANGGTGISASCAVTVSTAPTGALLSYKYNEDEGFFYVEDDPWQRNFGFNRLYDWAAPIGVMYYGTVRVQFTYNNIDWMIQMWKGQYGMAFIGSEIGVYTRQAGQYPNSNLNHYDCASDENSLNMQMSLYQKDKWLFDRTYRTYWWVTGFVPGVLSRLKDPSELTMLAIITLKDSAMKDAFVSALEGCGFTNGAYNGFSTPDVYRVEGNSVYFNWKNINIENRVKITFDANGGTGGWGPTMMDYGAPLTAPVVERAGYTFLGWSSVKQASTLFPIITIPSKVPSADKIYYAQWQINS